MRASKMCKVLEGPMQWRFCSGECACTWADERHGHAHELLKVPAGTRAKIPVDQKDAFCEATTGHSAATLRELCDGRVPMPEDQRLP